MSNQETADTEVEIKNKPDGTDAELVLYDAMVTAGVKSGDAYYAILMRRDLFGKR